MSQNPRRPKDVLHIEDLPRLAVPIVDFIEEEKPDIIIGCDRGARLFALAVHSMWRELHTEKFPTLDGKLHFARVSNSLSKYQQRHELARVIPTERPVSKNKDPLHILFIDENVRLANTLMDARKATSAVHTSPHRVSFGAIFGVYGDVLATDQEYTRPYSDSPNQIGIDYEFQPTENGIMLPVAINAMSHQARQNRKIIHQASKTVASELREVATLSEGTTSQASHLD